MAGVMNAPKQVTGFAVYGDHFDLHDIIGDRRDPAQLVPALDLRCDRSTSSRRRRGAREPVS